jgi:PAS domain S-box-containing protein
LKKIVLFLILINIANLFSEYTVTDSLENELKFAKGSERAKILKNLCIEYWYLDSPKSISYGMKALEAAKESNDNKQVIESIIDLGVSIELSGDLEHALDYYNSAVDSSRIINYFAGIGRALKNKGMVEEENKDYEKAVVSYSEAAKYFLKAQKNESAMYSFMNIGTLYEEIHNYEKSLDAYLQSMSLVQLDSDKDMLINLYNYIGNAYSYLSDYSKALENFMEAYKLANKSGNPEIISETINHIANVYQTLKNYNLALQYFEKALEIDEKSDDDALRSVTYNNIANAYSSLKEYDLALDYYNKAMEIDRASDYEQGISTALNNIALIHHERKNFKLAKEEYLESLRISEKYNDKWAIANTSNNIGELYYDIKEYDKAFQYVNKGLEHAMEMKVSDVLMESYNILSMINYAVKNYKQGYECFQKYVSIKDSIFSESISKISSLHMKYQDQTKKQEIELLKAEKTYQLNLSNILITVLFIGSIFILILIYLYMSKRKENNKRKITEFKLRESEETFRVFTEKLRSIVYTINENGFFSYINPRAEEVIGYTEDELLRMQFHEIIHPDHRAMVLQRGTARLNKENPVDNYEFKIITKQGAEKWLEVSNGLIEVKGKPVILGTAMDISEKYRLQLVREAVYNISKAVNQLNKPDDLYNLIHTELNKVLDATNFYIALYDEKTNIIETPYYVDEKAESIPLPQELKNKGLTSYIIKTAESLYLPETKRIRMLEENLIYGKNWTSKIWMGTPLMIEGRVIGAIAVQNYHDPLCYSEKDIEILELFSHQIAIAIDKNSKERELKESEERFRIIFEEAEDVIFIKDEKMNFIFINPYFEKVFKVKKEKLLGRTFLEFTNKKELALEIKEEDKVVFGGKTLNKIKKFDVKGNDIFLDLTKIPLKNDNGKTIGICGIARDITERIKTNEQIKSSLKEKEIMLKEIHHRVKNNMQIINSMLKMQSRFITDQKTLNIFKESQNRIKSMALIHEKLYLSESLSDIDFKNYIHQLIKYLIMSYNINSNNIVFIVDIGDITIDIENAVPCGLIINELISNSLKHAFPEGRSGEIFISVSADKDKYALVIKNDGIDFPEEIDTDNTKTLGLRLVHTLVNQLDGKIEINKTGGVEFKITFSKQDRYYEA